MQSSTLPTNTPDKFSFKDATSEEVLEDLSSRFILNLPDEELSSIERICFQVEQAHWFYEDFVRDENPSLPSLPLKKFSAMLFHACPLLRQWSHDHEQAFNNFMQYKTRVPVCGAIMLNDTWEKCVLVKGWKANSGWGFPKGKINQDEAEWDCAIREVLEETGYDLTNQIRKKDSIKLTIREQRITLYVVGGVPEDFPFQTRTRKEISKIDWFKLTDLPTWKRSRTGAGKFYLISPFIGPLKEFIANRKPWTGQNGTTSGKANNTSPAKVNSATPVKINGASSAKENGAPSAKERRRKAAPPLSTTTSTSAPASSSSAASAPTSLIDNLFARIDDSQLVSDGTVEPAPDAHVQRLINSLVISESSTSTIHPETLLPPTFSDPQATSTPQMSPTPPASSSTGSPDLHVVQAAAHHGVSILRRPHGAVPLSVIPTPPASSNESSESSAHSPTDGDFVRKKRARQIALLESVSEELSNRPPSPLVQHPVFPVIPPPQSRHLARYSVPIPTSYLQNSPALSLHIPPYHHSTLSTTGPMNNQQGHLLALLNSPPEALPVPAIDPLHPPSGPAPWSNAPFPSLPSSAPGPPPSPPPNMFVPLGPAPVPFASGARLAGGESMLLPARASASAHTLPYPHPVALSPFGHQPPPPLLLHPPRREPFVHPSQMVRAPTATSAGLLSIFNGPARP